MKTNLNNFTLGRGSEIQLRVGAHNINLINPVAAAGHCAGVVLMLGL